MPVVTQFPVHFYEEGSMPLTMNIFYEKDGAIYSQESDDYAPLDTFVRFFDFIEKSYEKRRTVR
jgi:hypothetical protein